MAGVIRGSLRGVRSVSQGSKSMRERFWLSLCMRLGWSARRPRTGTMSSPP